MLSIIKTEENGEDVAFPIQNVHTDLTLVAKFSNDYTISFAQDVAGQRTVLHTEKVTVGEVIPEPPVTVQNNLELPNGEHFTYKITAMITDQAQTFKAAEKLTYLMFFQKWKCVVKRFIF
ncbi:hypothetical protein [Pseudolactococcus reticulitermitis]|uniref:Uncharacterized protein n=1 Tax=Pseudolactococcus reticulitermitis TaxID=2025039 RepID=A0A224X951_9LACT|nr:hypothetical protein [Lactococcus reticulitermitis]GAX47800.1 hypothetical protein RsY01_1404 [Lactococcus reticulitermitis]